MTFFERVKQRLLAKFWDSHVLRLARWFARRGSPGMAGRIGNGAFTRAIQHHPHPLPHVTVGRHTYGAVRRIFYYPTPAAPVTIGNFCSIAHEVRIICQADHSTRLPSSYPFRTLMTRRFAAVTDPTNHNHDAVTKGAITIGHDVWIAERAVILSGSTIGTGAVIGGSAVVAGNVPPYAIVVGNPGKVIKYRHEKYIDRLLASNWWDLPDVEIAALDEAFYSEDMENFLVEVDKAWARVKGAQA